MIRKHLQRPSINKELVKKEEGLLRLTEKQSNTIPSTVEISRSVVYFFGLILLGSVFVSGYFMGKTSGLLGSGTVSGTAVGAINPLPTQIQPQIQQPQQPSKPQVTLETIKALFSKDVVKFGTGESKLLMVEVADPSCPYCQVAAGVNTEIGAQMGSQFKLISQGGTYIPPVPEMRKLVNQGKADLVWIYTRGHGNGELGTKALYCAFDQDKFWQAHDLLLSSKGYDLLNNQVKNDTTKTQQLVDFLTDEVNPTKLKKCLDSGKYDSRLNDEIAISSSLGVNGTPGFYLNTTNFAGAYSWTDMKSAAEAALK